MSLLLTYIFIVLGVSFICSMLESVILSVTHSHIGTLIKSNPKRGKILQALKDDINRPLAAILTINTVANTVGAAGVGAQTLQVFGSETVAVISVGLTFCILIFSDEKLKVLTGLKRSGRQLPAWIRVLHHSGLSGYQAEKAETA